MPRGVPNVKAEKPDEAPEVDSPEVAEPDAVEAPAEEPDEAPAGEGVEPSGRWESFEATRPDGKVVIVKRNIDTGEQSVTDK